MSNQESKKEIRKPKLRLPFTPKKWDMGEWAYDHRIGLCSMVIAYLLFAIIFVSAKIFVGSPPHSQGFYIDLEQLEALEKLRDELEEQVKEKQQEEFDWNSVRNRASNENSLDERVVDDRGTSASALNEEAARTQREMEENRKAFEEAINSIEEQRREQQQSEEDSSQQRRDVRQKGNVTVSYSFADPVRHSQRLIVPAYQCEGGGEVVVSVELDPQGKVISSKVSKGGDRCMQETAIKAANSSTFDVNGSAPLRHKGTITYIFIPQ